MNRRNFIKSIGLGTLFVTSGTSLRASRKDKPNILIIMADDLGYNDLGFQGSKKVKSPHLDKLAAEGMRFSDGHVCASVCSPSRAGFVTGRYQQRFGHEANCPPKDKGMNLSEKTMGDHFQKIGYKTAILGKWHLGDKDEFHPNKRGFDEFWGFREGGRSYWYKGKKEKPGPNTVEHNSKYVKWDGYLTDRLGDKAVEYIEKFKDEPFLIFLSYNAPHSPFEAKKEDMKELKTKNIYHTMIYSMDKSIGNVIAKLEKTGLKDNTMIWFLSDNGGVSKSASNSPLYGVKGTEFEGGMRVPFVLNWHGKVPQGKIYDPMISSLDILPTSLIAAGGKLPEKKPLDGKDIMPYITGKSEGIPHERLFWRRLNLAAVREGDWKLIRVKGYDEYILYNLKNDLQESKNLAKKMPEKVKMMVNALEEWENTLTKPYWKEDQKWTKWRYNQHINRIKEESSGQSDGNKKPRKKKKRR